MLKLNQVKGRGVRPGPVFPGGKTLIYSFDQVYWIKETPRYSVLETITERIYKKTWHKLATNKTMKKLIAETPGKNENWELVKENTGTEFYWVTDKTLTLLHLKGATSELF